MGLSQAVTLGELVIASFVLIILVLLSLSVICMNSVSFSLMDPSE